MKLLEHWEQLNSWVVMTKDLTSHGDVALVCGLLLDAAQSAHVGLLSPGSQQLALSTWCCSQVSAVLLMSGSVTGPELLCLSKMKCLLAFLIVTLSDWCEMLEGWSWANVAVLVSVSIKAGNWESVCGLLYWIKNLFMAAVGKTTCSASWWFL